MAATRDSQWWCVVGGCDNGWRLRARDVGVWVCGCVGVWVCVCGCVGVWVCGFVSMWVYLKKPTHDRVQHGVVWCFSLAILPVLNHLLGQRERPLLLWWESQACSELM
jgi:hypothetical protein